MTPRVMVQDDITRKVTVSETGCWEWNGAITTAGYGTFGFNGHTHYAHREAYRLWISTVPEGYEVDHLCRNRSCCNPEHLEAVTPAVNKQRQGAAVTHCPHGHSLDDCYWSKRGTRICRTCAKDRTQRNRDLKKGVMA